MRIATLSRLMPSTLLALVLVGTVQTSAAGGASTAATLYDQTDNASSPGSNSQNFEATYDPYDNQTADDFVVPAGPSWIVDRVEAPGEYLSGPGPADSVNVTFYQNAGSLPGVEVASRPAVIPADGLASGDFGINLSPITLAPGHYWVSVQANGDLADGQWYWTERTVQANNPAAWRNPPDGNATGCTDWAPRASTCMWGSEVDQAFRILGSIQTPPPPSFNLSSNKVKEGKPVTFQVGLSAAPTQSFDVPFATQDGSAKGGKDFKATAGILTFAPGETAKTVVVKTKDDHKDEKSKEKFSLVITSGGTVFPIQATVKDNDK